MKKRIWLDLEETIIVSWEQFRLNQFSTINEKPIRKYLRENGIEDIGIFSFAIWDEKDKSIFKNEMLPVLSSLLGVTISEFPSIEELMKLDTKSRKINWIDRTDFMNCNDKFISFLNFARFNGEYKHHILIDDMVDNWIMTCNNSIVIETINISTLIGNR